MNATINVSGKKYYSKQEGAWFINLAVFHVFFGIVCGFYPFLAYYWGLGVLIFGIYKILQTNDKYLDAAKFAGYYMAMEAILRVTKGYLTWEFGKYGVILLLGLGLVVSSRKNIPIIFILFILLLIPSLMVIEFPDFRSARTSVLFNLSGPLCLAVSGLYFYRRKVTLDQLFSIFKYILLPLIALVSYLTFFTPDLETIEFGSEAIFETSGGFGPNQMATILGLGMSILMMALILKKPIFKFWWIDLGLLLYLGFRSLITFSRGGTISVLIVLTIFILILILKGKTRKLSRLIGLFVLITIGGVFIWSWTNKITEEALSYRYRGVNIRTGEKKDITAGRYIFLMNELSWFSKHPVFGIGPGMGKIYRKRELSVAAATHSEFSRLLGEHGIFGLVALLILILLPIKIFLTQKPELSVSITLIWVGLAMYTMFHSAMRLALPGFMYGLGLISLYVPRKKNTLHRKPTHHTRVHANRD